MAHLQISVFDMVKTREFHKCRKHPTPNRPSGGFRVSDARGLVGFFPMLIEHLTGNRLSMAFCVSDALGGNFSSEELLREYFTIRTAYYLIVVFEYIPVRYWHFRKLCITLGCE